MIKNTTEQIIVMINGNAGITAKGLSINIINPYRAFSGRIFLSDFFKISTKHLIIVFYHKLLTISIFFSFLNTKSPRDSDISELQGDFCLYKFFMSLYLNAFELTGAL